jgi:signal transduction histidine kinase
MNKAERKSRFALTLLLAAIIFSFMLVTLLLSAITGYFLIKSGIIASLSEASLTPNRIIVMITVNSLILGAIISAAISSFPLKPVNKIITQMNRLASGDFKARLEIEGPIAKHPAVREVTDSFNKMAQELESTEMLRSDFINNFSHEFKTPIVSIAGFAKLLKRGNLTEEQREEYIDIIEEESLRLSAMATNVLNLTKVENQTILTDVTEFNLSEQLRNSILALEGKWEKKNIDFNLDFDEHIISGNKDMLRHVWLNLIDNAIKFSPEGGSVEIGVKDMETTYEVTILNHGIEITQEQQSKIFKKFYQADESHASEGNGIGLALVKNVIDLHGGEVLVYSENGTTKFTVKLPKTQ